MDIALLPKQAIKSPNVFRLSFHFTTREDYIPLMKGLSLRNVELTIKRGKKVVYQDFGEMMFTHFGITGPWFCLPVPK